MLSRVLLKGAEGVTSSSSGTPQPQCIADLQRFIERHGYATRAETFDYLSRPPFSPLLLDEHMEQQQAATWQRMQHIAELNLIEGNWAWPTPEQNNNLWARLECLSMHDISLATTIGAQLGLCGGAISTMGTDEQREEFLPDISSCKIRGCFAMTELGHGSNVRGLETTATFDEATNEFVVHTPSDSAQKFWIGNAVLAKRAVVMAQLYTKGTCHGVHGFVVELRDENGDLSLGVRVADVGHKMGLNGVANARIWFNNVRVPGKNLLSRYGSVDQDGTYSSMIEDPNIRFTIVLAELLRGRIAIIANATGVAKVSLATAIRYGLSRRQFKIGDGKEETLIMDYPIHQRRLLPHLSMIYALQCASHRIQKMWNSRSEDIVQRTQQMKEIHLVSSGFKAIGGWYVRDAVQACREACGGQGYASWNKIGFMKADFDASLTYEGDNHVLLQGAATQITKLYRRGLKQRHFPADSLLFIHNSTLKFGSPLDEPCPVVWLDCAPGSDQDGERTAHRDQRDPGQSGYKDASTLLDTDAFKQATTGLTHPVWLWNCLQVREKSYLDALAENVEKKAQFFAQQMDTSEAEERAWTALGSEAVECGKALFERLMFQWFVDDMVAMKGKEAAYPMLVKLASLLGVWLIVRDERFAAMGTVSPGRWAEMRQELEVSLVEIRKDVECLVAGLAVPEFFLGPIGRVSGSNDEFWSYEQTLRNSRFAGRAKL